MIRKKPNNHERAEWTGGHQASRRSVRGLEGGAWPGGGGEAPNSQEGAERSGWGLVRVVRSTLNELIKPPGATTCIEKDDASFLTVDAGHGGGEGVFQLYYLGSVIYCLGSMISDSL